MPVGQDIATVPKSDFEKEKSRALDLENKYRDSRLAVNNLKTQVTDLQSELQQLSLNPKSTDAEMATTNDQNSKSSHFNPYNLLVNVPKLEPFSGAQPTQPVKQWVERVEKVTSSVALTEDQKVSLMKLLLTGPAEYTYNQYDANTKTNFSALCKRLIADFAHTGCTNTAAQILLKRAQRANEHVSEYGLALIQLYESAFSSPISVEGKSIIRQCFLSGLLPHVKAAMQYVNPLPDSLDELIKRAAEFETRWSNEHRSPVVDANVSQISTPHSIESTAMQSVLQKLSLLSTQMEELHSDKLHETRAIVKRDSNSSDYDAKRDSRTHNERKGSSSQTGGPADQNYAKQLTCFRCGRVGHVAAKCRSQLPQAPRFAGNRKFPYQQTFQNPRSSPGFTNARVYQGQPSNFNKRYSGQQSDSTQNFDRSPPRWPSKPQHHTRALEFNESEWPKLNDAVPKSDYTDFERNVFAITDLIIPQSIPHQYLNSTSMAMQRPNLNLDLYPTRAPDATPTDDDHGQSLARIEKTMHNMQNVLKYHGNQPSRRCRVSGAHVRPSLCPRGSTSQRP